MSATADDLYAQARDAAERGDPDAARDLATRAFEADPADPDVRELYAALHLAHAIRLSASARDARRDGIVRRSIGYDEEFADDEPVGRAFDDALAAVERVLETQPAHEKALMMKAALLFRRDRAAGRPQALEILRGLVKAHPENRQAAYTIRKIERPCARCSDTGFCPYCAGRGVKTFLRLERRCEACHGRGICLACGIL
jgi:tetratricopeptide (TPR) repeat protein